MQSKDTNTRASGALNHPDSAQWMAFLYGEIAPEKKRELSAHLASCAACASQLRTWGSAMEDLDQWTLPVTRPRRREWVPALKWAAAAALVLVVGFALGRYASPAGAELASLKSRVAQLEQNSSGKNQRLLADFTRLHEEQRAADQQQVARAFHAMDLRLTNLRTELETVAVNAETGFEQTHENITRLVALSAPVNQSTQQQ